MRISEKLMTKYKNMNLTRKMLLVYFGFAGIFLVVAVIAFQISMEAKKDCMRTLCMSWIITSRT